MEEVAGGGCGLGKPPSTEGWEPTALFTLGGDFWGDFPMALILSKSQGRSGGEWGWKCCIWGHGPKGNLGEKRVYIQGAFQARFPGDTP